MIKIQIMWHAVGGADLRPLHRDALHDTITKTKNPSLSGWILFFSHSRRTISTALGDRRDLGEVVRAKNHGRT